MTTRFVHVYTGTGKGKTTAALGVILRAIGAGWRVFLAQFLKTAGYSEHRALEAFGDRVLVRSYGSGKFVRGRPSKVDLALARQGMEEIARLLGSGHYDLVVLDEVNVAVDLGLVPLSWLLDLIDNRPSQVELILTGRNAHPEVIARAHLVTDMGEIKHYFHQGIGAREGIEK